jgi:thiol-disulfide isomerase/thioredoxin
MMCGTKGATESKGLFVADWEMGDIAEKILAKKTVYNSLKAKRVPEIVAEKWINSPQPVVLDSLTNQVVLLAFFGTWFLPCDDDLPRLEELQQMYKDRGLVVIGIHAKRGSDKLPATINEHSLTFPVAIDSGKTAENYGVDFWPNYFLIDKSGKLSRGLSTTLPSTVDIEKLLE